METRSLPTRDIKWSKPAPYPYINCGKGLGGFIVKPLPLSLFCKSKAKHKQKDHHQIGSCKTSRIACGPNYGRGRGRSGACGSTSCRSGICCLFGGRGCWVSAPYFGAPSLQARLVDGCQWKCALWHWHKTTRYSTLLVTNLLDIIVLFGTGIIILNHKINLPAQSTVIGT